MFRLIKKIKDKGRWRIFKLKLIDARLYFVSIFVGLLTGLVAVPYHYLLQFFFNLRHDFFDSRPKWYWYIPLFLFDVGNTCIRILVGKENAAYYRWGYSANTWSYQWQG